MERILENKKIFIVEDNVTNLAVFSTTLRAHGAQMIQDFWNYRTIELLKAVLPVDIILLDLMLHNGVSGYSIFEALKQEECLVNIPVVAVSASEPSVEIPKAMKLGLSGFIPKPISLKDFPRQIASCIAGEKLWLHESRPSY